MLLDSTRSRLAEKITDCNFVLLIFYSFFFIFKIIVIYKIYLAFNFQAPVELHDYTFLHYRCSFYKLSLRESLNINETLCCLQIMLVSLIVKKRQKEF